MQDDIKKILGFGGLALVVIAVMKRDQLLQWFDLTEFDSADLPGSGIAMQASTLSKLDKARGYANVPFNILSGFRTQEHNNAVGGSANSAHMYGFAADILTSGEENSKRIARALYQSGFRRFGIRHNFSSIHVDDDPSKPVAVWDYDGDESTPPPYLPQNLT